MEDDYRKGFPLRRIWHFSPQTPLAWLVGLPVRLVLVPGATLGNRTPVLLHFFRLAHEVTDT